MTVDPAALIASIAAALSQLEELDIDARIDEGKITFERYWGGEQISEIARIADGGAWTVS